MQISVISFTNKGEELSIRLKEQMKEEDVRLYTKCSFAKEEKVKKVNVSLSSWTKEQFQSRNGIVFIGACGIAVRAISPYVEGKLKDSPVLVIDELGQYVIPILSGHVGGANALAMNISEKMGATPVITTATDLHGLFQVDVFAKQNHLWIHEKEGIGKVSSKILRGEKVTIAIPKERMKREGKMHPSLQIVGETFLSPDIVISEEKPTKEHLLWLEPKTIVLGVGCRKGKSFEEVELFLREACERFSIQEEQIFAMASIDCKKEEKALLKWSNRYRVPFYTYSSKELQMVSGEYSASSFVQAQVGVDNVCERAAMKACQEEGEFLMRKHAGNGITAAFVKRNWRVVFDEI